MIRACAAARTTRAVCRAVTHFGGVIAARTGADTAVALDAARATLSYLEEGGVRWRAVVHINRLVRGSCGVCGDPGCVADFTTVAVAVGVTRAHALGITQAVHGLAAAVCAGAAISRLEVEWLAREGRAIV